MNPPEKNHHQIPPFFTNHFFDWLRFARFVINKTNTLAGTPEYMAPEAIWIVLGSDLELFGYLKSLIREEFGAIPSFLTTF